MPAPDLALTLEMGTANERHVSLRATTPTGAALLAI
jgi:hypothetical protein